MTSIFVTKLDFNTTDTELKALFEQYGKVNRVTIAKDRETGKPRGFAFVEMFNQPEAVSAIEALDNTSFKGRTIAVKQADDRGSKPGGGSQGSGGFQRNDRNERSEQRPPRSEHQSDYRANDRPPRREEGTPFVPPPVVDAPPKTERKKEPKVSSKKPFSDQPKQHKMEAYKKSGKGNRFFDDDEDEDFDDWRSHRRESGWDEEE